MIQISSSCNNSGKTRRRKRGRWEAKKELIPPSPTFEIEAKAFSFVFSSFQPERLRGKTSGFIVVTVIVPSHETTRPGPGRPCRKADKLCCKARPHTSHPAKEMAQENHKAQSRQCCSACGKGPKAKHRSHSPIPQGRIIYDVSAS